MFSKWRIIAPTILFAACVATAGAQSKTGNSIQKAGKYAVELRIPAEGLFAEEETDVEFRITDSSQDDPVQGAPPVVNARLSADVTMPAMPAMPAQKPKTHREGVPGDYGVLLYFPHGGDYKLALTIAPPGDEPFTVAFKLSVGDALPPGKRPAKLQPYTLEVTTSPAQPRAGEPTALTIAIRSRASKQLTTEFETVHERPMHFIIVSRDLSQFSHEHPELGSDGRFTLKYTFPTGGEYRLFADTAPKGAGSVVLSQTIKVAGPSPSRPGLPDPTPKATADGVAVAIPQGQLTAGRTIPMTFNLADAADGAPITDVQPWLGAIAHLILIHEDGTVFVHSHPDESDPSNGNQGKITFLARFPKPGAYRGWLQFQRQGTVKTAAFTVKANAPVRPLSANAVPSN